MANSPDLIPNLYEMVQSSVAIGVQNFLRERLTTLDQSQITVEYDELPPNLTGNWHLCVIPMGFTPNNQLRNGEIYDWKVMFDIALLRRVQDMPKDRMREKFATNAASLLNAMGAINYVIDGEYSLMNFINDELGRQYGKVTDLDISSYGFVEPQVLVSAGPVRSAGFGLFGGANSADIAALVCRFRYGNLRIITPKSLHME